MLLSGIEPVSPNPGRWTRVTRVPSELQVTPTQDVQTAAESFQLSLGACRTLEANSYRACLSELRSATIKPKRDSLKLRMKSAKVKDWSVMGALFGAEVKQMVFPRSELSCSSLFPGLVLKNYDNSLADHAQSQNYATSYSKTWKHSGQA